MPTLSARQWLWLSFAAVYLVWGSAFAVTKVMVTQLPPLAASACRFMIGGLLLLALARWRQDAWPRWPTDWRHFLVTATCQVVLSSGTNVWVMRHVASNQSALLNASGALWIPLLGTIGSKGHPLNTQAIFGITAGVVGVTLLLWPTEGFDWHSLGWQLMIIGACFFWAVGSLYFQRVSIHCSMLMYSAINMLVGSGELMLLASAHQEWSQWRFSFASVGALLFLGVFSSAIAYTAYNYLARHTTPAQLSTYAYVNPAIAAVIGYVFLGEFLKSTQIFGMIIIIFSVVLVTLAEFPG